MSLQERLERLQPRERRLLNLLVIVFVVFVVLLVPLGVFTLLSSKRSDNADLRDAINAIQDGRERVKKREAAQKAILDRYTKPAPGLAAFLEQQAKASNLEIPESQDRAPVPHGKQYEERSTKIVLRRVGMFNLIKLMERIAKSNHPVRISRLNIRKRGGAGNDSYDVQMIVSAFDRKVKEKPKEEEEEEEDVEEENGEEEEAP